MRLSFELAGIAGLLVSQAVNDGDDWIEDAPLRLAPRLQQAIASRHIFADIHRAVGWVEQFFVVRTPILIAKIPPHSERAEQMRDDVGDNRLGHVAGHNSHRINQEQQRGVVSPPFGRIVLHAFAGQDRFQCRLPMLDQRFRAAAGLINERPRCPQRHLRGSHRDEIISQRDQPGGRDTDT